MNLLIRAKTRHINLPNLIFSGVVCILPFFVNDNMNSLMQIIEIGGKEDSFLWGICVFGDQVYNE